MYLSHTIGCILAILLAIQVRTLIGAGYSTIVIDTKELVTNCYGHVSAHDVIFPIYQKAWAFFGISFMAVQYIRVDKHIITVVVHLC